MSNVISLFGYRSVKQSDSKEINYKTKLSAMSKAELLKEMARFQAERELVGCLTDEMMRHGRHLFKSLEDCADSQELKILSRSYRRHLEYEIEAARALLQETTQ